jgi:hypothetical protein
MGNEGESHVGGYVKLATRRPNITLRSGGLGIAPCALARLFSVGFETLFSQRKHRKRVRKTHYSVALPHLDELFGHAMKLL